MSSVQVSGEGATESRRDGAADKTLEVVVLPISAATGEELPT